MKRVAYRNLTQLITLEGVRNKKGRRPTEKDLSVIENATIIVDKEKEIIEWMGPTASTPSFEAEVLSGEGKILMPEWVECHTHLLFAGERYHDYALRASGLSYAEVAAKGGGILSTVKETRNASVSELVEKGEESLDYFQRQGVGAIEIKSGYGLTLKSEIKLLEAVHELQKRTSLKLVPTFLPAHAVPPEFSNSKEFTDAICREWIPEIAKQKLATFIDVFLEEGYFNHEETRRLAKSAQENGFKLKLHVDQFHFNGGAELAVELEATSCDHLDHISDSGVAALSKSETVAVLLPGASLFTGTPFPPARRLLDQGARVALSTNYNPGTSPTRNLNLMMTLGCSQMRMTVPESLVAITYNAACALNIDDSFGSLKVGGPFRACMMELPSYEAIPYRF